MKILKYLTIVTFLVSSGFEIFAEDTISFKGQLSAYTHYNGNNEIPWMSGIRYIPQLNLISTNNNQRMFDLEASANLNVNAGIKTFTETDFTGRIKPYRFWARYSSNQFEIRAGLQKINFGSASLLRPLMWFDQIDSRDPLKLTDGVWGILSRYYFLNNANIWIWGLYGNENLKGWEFMNSKKNIPEFGGRIQYPLPKGEAGLSFHHRTADGTTLHDSLAYDGRIPENRFGFDAKFDMIIGWWVEASWSNFRKPIGGLYNQEAINLGADYTFGIGNGLTATFEQLLSSGDQKPFGFDNVSSFSLLSLSYPIGMFDNLSAIIYYDWTNKAAYNFITWHKQFNRVDLYFMGYINPKVYNIPSQKSGEMIYAGKGLQFMVVFNH